MNLLKYNVYKEGFTRVQRNTRFFKTFNNTNKSHGVNSNGVISGESSRILMFNLRDNHLRQLRLDYANIAIT